MSLGERLAALRIKQGLSQGELAEKMDVSRQSVSKWETDASIPELDKLVALSELFQISLDELIKGASSQPCSQAAENSSPPPGSQNPSGKACARTTGWGLLLGAGLLCCAAGILLLDIPGLLGIYFVLCGILCARVRSYLVLHPCMAHSYPADVSVGRPSDNIRPACQCSCALRRMGVCAGQRGSLVLGDASRPKK